jgi:RNA polymerase sigma factor (sigma-70 family)
LRVPFDLPKILDQLKHVSAEPRDELQTRPSLLSKVRRGEEDAWQEFYEFYRKFIYALATRSFLSHEEASDIVQETMASVHKYIADFKVDSDRAQFRTWLRTIVASRIADKKRKLQRDPLAHPGLAHDTATDHSHRTAPINRIPDSGENDFAEIFDVQLKQSALAQAQDRIRQSAKIEHFQVYDLYEIEQMSARDVAKTMGINEALVRLRSFRIKMAVAKEARRILNAKTPDGFRK